MALKFFENLREKPYEVRVWATLAITGIAALILVPLWIWNLGSLGIKTQAPAAATPESVKVQSPIAEIDEQLKEKFASPVVVTKVESTGSETIVTFKVENNTLADLEFPTKATLARSNAPLYSVTDFKKMTTLSGTEFPVLIARSSSVEGRMHFSKVQNGSYVITMSDLRYSAENQDAFKQLIHIEVSNALTPRS